jgi:hypothetical protein
MVVAGKLLVVDLKTETIEKMELPVSLLRRFLRDGGLTAGS